MAGYAIDVYCGDIKPEANYFKLAAFITFFPQLVAGPIERAANLLPQIKSEHGFDYNMVVHGLKLMALGFFKKLVLADNLSEYVDAVFNDVYSFRGFSLVLAAFFFTFQIYCDFSGYSDIAVGSAEVLGIRLMANFSSPYYSGSLREFWSRWHISLSSWFRDYLYIPLGGNRKGKIRKYINLFLTFLASGLWHGADWTFVIWGGLHGLCRILEDVLGIAGKKKTKLFKMVSVFLVFIIIAVLWVFFRAETFSDAMYVLSHSLEGIGTPVKYILEGFYAVGIGKFSMVYIGCSLLALAVYDGLSRKGDVIAVVSGSKIRFIIYYAILLWIIMFGSFGSNQFVYFQF